MHPDEKQLKVLYVTAGDFTPETVNLNRVQRAVLAPPDVDVHVLVSRRARLSVRLPSNVTVHRSRLPGRVGLYAAELALLLTARRRGIDAVATPNTFLSVPAWFCRRVGGYRWVADLWDVPHNQLVSYYAFEHGVMNSLREAGARLKVAVFEHVLPRSDLVVACVSPEGLERYAIPEARLRAVGNAIVRPKTPLEDSSRRRPESICFVSSFFSPDSGLDILAGAVAVLASRGWTNVRVGVAGALPANVEASVRGSAMAGRFDLLGPLSHDAAWELMNESEVGVLPYRANEDFSYRHPVKLFEYMAAGCVVVASDLVGIREVVRPDKDALLVPAGDATALADALQRVFVDSAARDTMRVCARERLNAFDARRKAERVYAEIRNVCAPSRAGAVDIRRVERPATEGRGR